MDLVHTRPGQRERYLRFSELNWMPMRRAFVEEGIARSFRVLVAPPDSATGWDVMLMTEYVDEEAYGRREEVFRRVAERPDYGQRLVDGLGARELAEIMTTHVLREAASTE